MIEARWVALPKWTRTPSLAGRPASFKMTYTATLDKLECELKKLDAADIRIEAGYSSHQIRNDGWPRGGQAPAHPGVVIYFIGRARGFGWGKEGELCFPCGSYSSMHANLHAIALTLECLRAVDRYGVTVRNEQYAGFLALPAAGSESMTLEQAAALVAEAGTRSTFRADPSMMLRDPELFRAAYRNAASVLHPDAAADGADAGRWFRFQTAADLLKKHHRLAGVPGW
jgi:hypothetical protein